MNVYIDLGCHDGKTVEEFRNWRKLAFPFMKEWEIYAYDPNPEVKKKWDIIKDENTFFFQQAVWIKAGEFDFALDGQGSTLMKGKKGAWDGEVIKVRAINIMNILEQFCEDFVVVKMDTEGAEFPVLNKLLDDGTIDIIDVLLVEFHPNKVVEYTTDDKNNLIKRIKEAGVTILEWH